MLCIKDFRISISILYTEYLRSPVSILYIQNLRSIVSTMCSKDFKSTIRMTCIKDFKNMVSMFCINNLRCTAVSSVVCSASRISEHSKYTLASGISKTVKADSKLWWLPAWHRATIFNVRIWLRGSQQGISSVYRMRGYFMG